MGADFDFPNKKAAIYWPIGTGDSTTLILRPNELVVQVDLRHLAKADDAQNPEWPIIDYLVRSLPRRQGRPYLAAFVLTHPDQDHVQGFAELLKKVTIGELWHTPTIFRDPDDQSSLCDDAKAFRKEAHRRCKVVIDKAGQVGSGDRLRVIGHDEVLNEEAYKGLPPACKSRPGDKVSVVDGANIPQDFHAFIHAPFKDDQAKDRNNTSLSLNVVIQEGEKYAQFLFFGDREYPTIKRIFETTEKGGNKAYLSWDVMLCAHHCSKAVMYWQDEGTDSETLKKDIMDYFARYSRSGGGYIVSSSLSDFTNEEGKNPPHKKARDQYEKIVKAGHFICTHEYPNKDKPLPVVFTIGTDGFGMDDTRTRGKGPAGLAATVEAARGGSKPPAVQVGFGL